MFTEFEKKMDEIKRYLDLLDTAREELLKLTRDLRRRATSAIAEVHRNSLENAENMLKECFNHLEKIKYYEDDFPEIYYPITRDPIQEFIEAYVFFSIIKNREIAIPEVKVHPSPILTGLADCVGELRRYALEMMREMKVKEANEMINFMEAIYSKLIEFDYPDKIVPLKSKLDMVRLAIERTKSDLLSVMRLINETG
ncbi:putative RNA-binding protein of the translin family [Archaeoglobus sulfaticallidus PM70-1]|uniref:Putative RNA-binding protein of the translin family n=1 Tax=Archaeoglobus sulfaticallidus PM70-1 TaxID=387631 RepID=N0BBH0_9EURY|nr:RNA-binding protein [Archaeoglobus sulfaticallidus]AGK60944.1 putative RNA-binding protein of the translin family [Archaeoglobus sulfaticallidus PM70-1]